MFPPSGAQIYRNEAGEPMGWDMPSDPSDYYCDDCGVSHTGPCDDDMDEDEPDYDESPDQMGLDDINPADCAAQGHTPSDHF